MKTPSLYPRAGWLFILTLAILTCGIKVIAQTTDSNLVPIVTVQATQPMATMSNAGVFTVFRAGNTNATLNVWFDLGGTASNGVDYAAISNHLVEIPAGVTSNTVVITPIESAAMSVVKTVVLTLTNSPLLNPVNYQIGSPSQAVVYIEENGATNLPPSVSIIEPKDGDLFYTPTNILILAKASDPGRFSHQRRILRRPAGSRFWNARCARSAGRQRHYWLGVFLQLAQSVRLLAVFLYRRWLQTTAASPPLLRRSTSLCCQGPPTNLPPVVRIVSPANGSVFRAPINLPLYAFASDPDGSVTSVQFFAGANSLGFGQRLPVVEPLASGNVIVVGGPRRRFIRPIYSS